jgi:hypothetical protein
MTTPIPDGWHSVIHVKYWEIIADNLSKADWSWGASQPPTRLDRPVSGFILAPWSDLSFNI